MSMSPVACGAPIGLLGLLTLCGVAQPAHAAIVVQDYSFEGPVASDGGVATRPATWTGTGWVFNPNNVHFAGTSGASGTLPTPADGKQMLSVDLNGSNLTRTITYAGTSLGTYEAGATYTLVAAGGQRLDQPARWADGDGVTRNHYIKFTVSLLARDNGASPWSIIDTSPEATLTAVGTFADAVDVYTATPAVAGKEIGIQITVKGSWTQGQIDNVRLSAVTAVVPEPTGGLALLGAGAGGLLSRRRRRRHAAR